MYQNLYEEEKNKKRKSGRGWYKNFSDEEKEKNRQYDCDHCSNVPGDQKLRIVEYEKNDYTIQEKLLC